MAVHHNLLIILALCFACLIELPSSLILAGATGGQWVVVVNGNSEASLTLANVYAQLRDIPAINMIVLDDVPEQERINVNQFRKSILEPVLREIDARRLSGRIQGIAYSADFPTAINLAPDLKAIESRPQYLTPIGSINGCTYLFRYCMRKDPNIVQLESNLYAGSSTDRYFAQPFFSDDRTAWISAKRASKDGNHSAAANSLSELFDRHPYQFPVAFESAVEFAKAKLNDKAIEMLEKAIAANWSFRSRIETEPAFADLKKLNRFSFLLEACGNDEFDFMPTRGFQSMAFYAPNGVAGPNQNEGISYMLSIVLGVTRGEGTSLRQAIEQLTRSARADYQRPQGQFYFSATPDARSQARQPGFPIAIERLKKLGYRGEIITSIMPMRKPQCLGVMIGRSTFDWSSSGSKLMEGAIAENMTSLGGVMEPGSNQTKLTEFLLQGAAASSGTVTEPYSIQAKFPHAMMHAYYADGLTLAEAFYSAISGPYQLLIVGDPLCQPFANSPDVRLEHWSLSQPELRLKFELSAQPRLNGPSPAYLELFVDGVPIASGPFSRMFDLKLSNASPGYHELGMIVIDDSNARSKRELRKPFILGGPEEQVKLELALPLPKEEIKLRVATQSNADRIDIRHLSRTIASTTESMAELSVPQIRVGYGPAIFQAVAIRNGLEVFSEPLIVNIPLP